MHSHVSYLLEKSDYVFLPFYFENRTKDKNKKRQFCYYTQYLPSIVSTVPGINKERLISPVIKYLYTNFYTKIELYRSLKKISDKKISFFDISSAYDKALEWKKGYSNRLKNILNHKRENSNDVDVVLLGRPYTILSPTLNSSIPDIFSSLKIKIFLSLISNGK